MSIIEISGSRKMEVRIFLLIHLLLMIQQSLLLQRCMIIRETRWHLQETEIFTRKVRTAGYIYGMTTREKLFM